MVKKKVQSSSSNAVAKLMEKKAEKKGQVQAPMIQAMVWYKEEHYERLLSLFDDKHLLPLTFGDWLVRAEDKKSEVEALGNQVIKVFIDPETFPEWCQNKKLPMDANSRSQLAIEVAKAQSFRV